MLDGHLLLLARQMRAAEEEQKRKPCGDSSPFSTEKVYRCNIALEMSK